MRNISFAAALAGTSLAVAIALPGLAGIPLAPAAKRVPVVNTYFGVRVSDPYQWMEQTNTPDFQAYLNAQNDRTRAILDSIPGRKALLARIRILSRTNSDSAGVLQRGELLFYEKVAPGSNISKIYVRRGIRGVERVVIDPNKLATSTHHIALSYWAPSNDGRLIVAGLAADGSENTSANVFDVDSGTRLADSIPGASFGNISWRDDNQAFYYAKLQAQQPGASSQIAKYQNVRTYLHVLGTDPAKDPAIFGSGVSPAIDIAPEELAFAHVEPQSPFAYALVLNGVQSEVTAYIAPKASVDGGHADWKRIVTPADQVTDLALHGDEIYLLSHKNAPRSDVIKISTSDVDLSKATVVIAPSPRVIQQMHVAHDGLYVTSLEDGLARVTRVDWAGARSEIALPFNGSIRDFSSEPNVPGFLAKLESWTVSPLWYTYDPSTNTLADSKLDPPSPVDFSNITSEEVKVKARDGTLIPLSLVHRKGLKMNGKSPLLLTAYGSYGSTFDSPVFAPGRLVWYDHGGITGIAHVRGGGIYGEEWHLAGKDANKINTINDLIDCAKWLVARKYTSPSKLAAGGGSAGGVPMGGAITRAPGLFAAILDEDPLSDTLRFERTPTGALNIPEFGSVKTLQGFKNLYAISAVANVHPGTKYPAVMLTTGANDPRVLPWQPAKLAATLQADSTSGKPILLRVDYAGGHGYVGATKEQGDQLSADEDSFLLWNMGVPGFQPTL